MFFSLFPDVLELIVSINDEVINQYSIESNDIGLNCGQPLLVNIAFKTVCVIVLLKHFQVFLGQSRWDSLEVRNILIYLHHKFALFICFQLFIDCGIFCQNLLMHPTGGGGHHGVVISQIQVVYRQSLACWILAIKWIQSLSHRVLALCLSNRMCSPIVLGRTRICC